MIKLVPELSTITEPNKIYSANQPIIITVTEVDSSKDHKYLQVALGEIYFKAYKNVGDYHTPYATPLYRFDLTDYVRSRFKYQEPELISSIYYSDDSIFRTFSFISIQALITGFDYVDTEYASLPTNDTTFVNCVVDREGNLNSFAPDGCFTHKNGTYDIWYKDGIALCKQYLTMQNTGQLFTFGGNSWISQSTTSLPKVFSLDVTVASKAVSTKMHLYNSFVTGDYVLTDEYTINGGDEVSIDIEGYLLERNGQKVTDKPTVVLTKDSDFDPEYFVKDNCLVMPFGTTSFVVPDGYNTLALVYEEYYYVKEVIEEDGELFVNGSGKVSVPYLKIVVGDNVTEEGNCIIFNKREVPHEFFFVKWINQYGGWDYYCFDHSRESAWSIEEASTLNIGKSNLIATPVKLYKKEINHTVTCKSKTERFEDFKALSFIGLSTKIMHLIEVNGEYKWEAIGVEDFERRYRPCEKAGSIEVQFITDNQYGLSILG